jgi:hypothetical protein
MVYGLQFTVYSLWFTVYSLRFTDEMTGGCSTAEVIICKL